MPLNICLLDDTLDVLRSLPGFRLLDGHRVNVLNEHHTDIDRLASHLVDADVIVLMRERTPIGAELLERLPRLQMISQISDTPHIDLTACTRSGVLVSSNRYPGAPHYRTLHATAELTWALALAASRRLPEHLQSLRDGRWQAGLGRSLRGRTLGIFGYGRIGSAVAGFGRAFGMTVQVWGSPASCERAAGDGYPRCHSREEFFATSDLVSLHLRLNPDTRGIVAAADLARMKPDSILINTSRAGLIAPGALLEALRTGRPGMAAVDVFDEEPMTDRSNPFLALDNFIGTPHIGYVEHDTSTTVLTTSTPRSTGRYWPGPGASRFTSPTPTCWRATRVRARTLRFNGDRIARGWRKNHAPPARAPAAAGPSKSRAG